MSHVNTGLLSQMQELCSLALMDVWQKEVFICSSRVCICSFVLEIPECENSHLDH